MTKRNNRSIWEAHTPFLNSSQHHAVLNYPNQPNHNNRTYSIDLWQRVLANGSAFQNRITNNEVIGSYIIGDYPPHYDVERPTCPAIIWEKVWIQGGLVAGWFVILNTPGGQLLQERLDRNDLPCYGPSGYGCLNHNEDGNQVIEADSYTLNTFDCCY